MIEKVCIIPARGGSKRLPRKNIKMFCGEPIIARPIRSAQESGMFSEIIVSSDDQEILEYSHSIGAHAIHRPEGLCTDNSPEISTYAHTINEISSSLEMLRPLAFCAIYPTAAFITKYDIINSYNRMISLGADSCMGVTKYESPHPYQALVESGSGDFHLAYPLGNELKKYPDAYASNGSLYWFNTNRFMMNNTYFPERLCVYETFNVDINTIDEFEKAEAIACKRT